MLPKTHIKERLSFSYIMAMAAEAGLICQKYEEDFGMDGRICDVVHKRDRNEFRHGVGIDFQLKATVNIIPKNGYFLYDLEIKNYLDLIDNDEWYGERILILYVLPKERCEWIEVGKEKTVLRKAAYWCSLKGFPVKNNKYRVRIEIPESQQLTPDVLKDIILKVKGGQSL